MLMSFPVTKSLQGLSNHRSCAIRLSRRLVSQLPLSWSEHNRSCLVVQTGQWSRLTAVRIAHTHTETHKLRILVAFVPLESRPPSKCAHTHVLSFPPPLPFLPHPPAIQHNFRRTRKWSHSILRMWETLQLCWIPCLLRFRNNLRELCPSSSSSLLISPPPPPRSSFQPILGGTGETFTELTT